MNPRGSTGGGEHAKTGLAASQADERARLSTRSRGLLGRSDDVCRREEPPRDESGLRAHGSNQRFHRLLRHAVARALTTAPSLAGVSPAADDILTLHGWRRKGRQGRCRTNHSETRCINWSTGSHMSVALIKARDRESESKIKRLVGDLSHHHLNSEYLNGLRNSLANRQHPHPDRIRRGTLLLRSSSSADARLLIGWQAGAGGRGSAGCAPAACLQSEVRIGAGR